MSNRSRFPRSVRAAISSKAAQARLGLSLRVRGRGAPAIGSHSVNGTAALPSRPPQRFALPVGAFLVAVVFAVIGAASALAGFGKVGEFGGTGNGNGQFRGVYDIAVEQASGDVYVADTNNHRIQVFDSTGAYKSQFNTSLRWPGSIAIDEANDVAYITEWSGANINKFDLSTTPPTHVLAWSPGPTSGNLWKAGILDVDSSGNLYVADAGPGEILVFDSSGNPVGSFGSTQLSEPLGLAFDSAGNLYVADETEGLLKFNSSGTLVATVASGADSPVSVAVDASDNVFAFFDGPRQVVKYDSTGSQLSAFGAGQFRLGEHGIEVGDTAQTIYVGDERDNQVLMFGEIPAGPPEVGGESANPGGNFATLRATVNPTSSEVTECYFEYGTTTAYGNQVACDPMPGAGASPVPVSADLTGLAEETEYHWRVFARNGEGSDTGTDQFFTTLKLPTASIEPVTGISATAATFSGTVNPEGTRTRYQFEYSTDGFTTVETVPDFSSDLGSGTDPVPVSENPADLSPNTAYEVRLRASSNTAGEATTAPVSFSTPRVPPTVSPGTGTAGRESATMRAYVNPHNEATSYYFEWGPDTSYGNRVPVPDGTLAPTSDPILVTEELGGLERKSTYHYRVVAQNPTGVTVGPDQSVTTTDTGMLRDRGIELVTPADGAGSTIVPFPQGGAAADGEAFLWHSRGSFGEDADGSPNIIDYYAERTADGWKTTNASPFLGNDAAGLVKTQEYRHWTPDLSHAFYSDTVGGPDALSSDLRYLDIFARGLPKGGYTLLSPEAPHGPNLPPPFNYRPPMIVGYTGDLGHVFIEPRMTGGANYSLCGEGFRVPCEVLPATGQARPVGVLPEHYQEIVLESDTRWWQISGAFTLTFDGEQTAQIPWPAAPPDIETALEALAGIDDVEVGAQPLGPFGVRFAVRFADPAWVNGPTPEVTADASNLSGETTISAGHQGVADRAQVGTGRRDGQAGDIWQTYGNRAISDDGTRAAFTAENKVFVRDTGTTPARTLEVPAGRLSEFVTANEDLSEVFVTGGGILRRYDIATEEVTTVVPSGFGGLVRASDDASHIYFMSGQQLVPDTPRGGIFLWRADGSPTGTIERVGAAEGEHLGQDDGSAYVTPDGRFLLFASTNPLTGYQWAATCNYPDPDTSWLAGSPCPQIYLFDAEAPEDEQLRCVSCHPDGEPVESVWRNDIQRHEWHYGNHNGTSPGGLGTTRRLAEPRYISDDGKTVFFQSHEPLLPADTNGQADVYEYDVPSGQLSLVTTGNPAAGTTRATWPPEATQDGFWIIDSSADGDVFFATGKALVPQDRDTLADIYVARAEGGFPDPVDDECQGDECRGDQTTPPDEEAIGSTTADGSNVDAEAQRCERLANRFQALKERFLRLRLAYHRADDPVLKRRIARRARRVKQRAIQVRQAARECRSNL